MFDYDNIRALIGFAGTLLLLFFLSYQYFPKIDRKRKKKEPESKESRIHSMAFDAFFLALMFLMTFVPNVGFIMVGPVTLTLLHLPVLLGAALFGWKRGLLYGLMFGLLSWFKAFTAATSVFDIAFQKAWISVLPRVLFGLASGLLFSLIRKLHKRGPLSLYLGIGAFLATCLHTFLVFLMLGVSEPWVSGWLFSSEPAIEGTGITVMIYLLIGMSGEATLGAILTPSIYNALTKSVPYLQKGALR